MTFKKIEEVSLEINRVIDYIRIYIYFLNFSNAIKGKREVRKPNEAREQEKWWLQVQTLSFVILNKKARPNYKHL